MNRNCGPKIKKIQAVVFMMHSVKFFCFFLNSKCMRNSKALIISERSSRSMIHLYVHDTRNNTTRRFHPHHTDQEDTQIAQILTILSDCRVPTTI